MVFEPGRRIHAAFESSGRIRDSRGRLGCGGQKQFRLVVWRSVEHGPEAWRHDRGAGEGTEYRRTQLDAANADCTDRGLGSVHRGVPREMTMPLRMKRRAAILLCEWSIVTAAMASQGFAASPQAGEQQGGSSVRSSAPDDAADSPPPKIGNLVHEPREGVSRSFSGLVKDFAGDQKGIWTSAGRLRFDDTEWLVPFAGITTGLFLTDRQVSGHLAADIKTQQHYRSIATDGSLALAGVGGGLAVWSAFSHSEHQRETGVLSGEAAIDSLFVVEAMKYSFQRQRPYQGNGAGHFLSGGTSFPSEHSAAVWSIAGIIAHEYPGRLPRLFAYGLATAVSLARIQSRDHFPSDVLVGSGIGYLISQYVYSKHHDPELGGAEWRSIREWVRDTKGTPGNLGSPYVPLDSWVYPAMERLAGLGLVDSGFAAMRPWTRLECHRLLNEASDAWSAGD